MMFAASQLSIFKPVALSRVDLISTYSESAIISI